MLPRIPLTKGTDDFKAFSKAGHKLAEWHLNYETVDPYPVKEQSDSLGLDKEEQFGVQKMVFARPTAEQKARGEKYDKSKIIYNSHITLHDVPVHHTAIDYLEAYLTAAGICNSSKTPLFRTIGPTGQLSEKRMHRSDALRMIKRQAKKAKIETQIGCHTWRATGITNYLSNGGTLENAARIAAHESPRTTMLYDRTSDAISLDEIERVRI